MNLPRVVYTVTDVNKYIKKIITNDENLKYIYVKGEISNFKVASNGHLYFSLKDKECLINCVMFNNYSSKLIFNPKNGDEVTVLASMDVYPTRGSYQLIVYTMEEVGQGAILIELEKLKKQLASEGLFDISRKREINLYPDAIGVITAPNSAAIKDIVTNIKRRYPICDIYVFPSSVQGENAPKELLKAFLKAQEYDLDTLIIGRGGGASEDLSAFNDEKLVRAIAESKMPVIAAIGHEIDSTLVDYVADKRASTPTGAAELATIDSREIIQHLDLAYEDMINAFKEMIEDNQDQIESYKNDLDQSIKELLNYYEQEVKLRKEKLILLNPNNILERGYSISLDSKGNVIDDIKKISLNEKIKTIVKNGEIVSEVKDLVKKGE